jgi:hypothetical protein
MNEQFLTSVQVQQRYNKTRETLRRWAADPRTHFLIPVKLGPGGIGPNSWRLSELLDWERQRAWGNVSR